MIPQARRLFGINNLLSFSYCEAGEITILIAHRVSTVVNADKIAVLKAGNVLEERRHEELTG